MDNQIIVENFSVLLDPKQVWKECLKLIKDNVPFITYNTWFLPIKPLALENSTFRLEVPNTFFIEWIDEHYNTLINKTIKQVVGFDAKLNYIVMEESSSINPTSSLEITSVAEVKVTPKEEILFESFLNQRYTFESFINGEGNQLARAAAVAIADNPGETSFNPFFIYGGVGLGKTHLI